MSILKDFCSNQGVFYLKSFFKRRTKNFLRVKNLVNDTALIKIRSVTSVEVFSSSVPQEGPLAALAN